MIKVVGVRFRNAGKVYFFAPGDFELKRGEHVIVETARGIEYGTCVNDPREVTDDEIVAPLKPILRIASERDTEQAENNRIKEKEAFKLCRQKIIEHELEMKLIDAEYTFDNSKILFYFTADGRIDFRELVKDLAAIFRTRIELRQVGVRDETKIIGGIGICGRPLCCHSYLADFVPVSIKMAKEQNLSLNPTKISGVCGRLMCCLKNEEDVYEEQNRKLPGVGDYVTTALGERGVVTKVNIFHETIKVLIQNGDEKEIKEYKAEEIRFKKHRKHGKLDLSPEELEQLKSLEPEDIAELGADAVPEIRLRGDIEETRTHDNSDRKQRSGEQFKPRKKGADTHEEGSQDNKNGENRSGDNGGRTGRDNRKRREHNGQDSEARSREQHEGAERDSRENRDNRESRDKNRRDHNRRDRRPYDRSGRENGENGENGQNRENGQGRENNQNRENGQNRENREDRAARRDMNGAQAQEHGENGGSSHRKEHYNYRGHRNHRQGNRQGNEGNTNGNANGNTSRSNGPDNA